MRVRFPLSALAALYKGSGGLYPKFPLPCPRASSLMFNGGLCRPTGSRERPAYYARLCLGTIQKMKEANSFPSDGSWRMCRFSVCRVRFPARAPLPFLSLMPGGGIHQSARKGAFSLICAGAINGRWRGYSRPRGAGSIPALRSTRCRRNGRPILTGRENRMAAGKDRLFLPKGGRR